MKKDKSKKIIILFIIISLFLIGCEKEKSVINNYEDRIESREGKREQREEITGKSEERQINTVFNDEYIELNYIEKIETDDKEWNIYKCKIINNFDKTITITYRDSKEKNTYSSMDINSNEEKEICYMLDNEEIKESMFSIYLTNDIEPHLLKDYYISF